MNSELIQRIMDRYTMGELLELIDIDMEDFLIHYDEEILEQIKELDI